MNEIIYYVEAVLLAIAGISHVFRLVCLWVTPKGFFKIYAEKPSKARLALYYLLVIAVTSHVLFTRFT